MFESVQGLLDEHDAIQAQLGDPAVYADQRLARKLGRRSAQLNGIVEAYHKWHGIQDDLSAAKEMAAEDPEFAAEVPELEAALETASAKLRRLLIPRDPDDARNVILEVKGGEGGDEAALFAADLLRMYTRYAETRGWKTELISATESDLGGYKDVQMAVKGNSNDPAEGVYARLKFEAGMRVLRARILAHQQEQIDAENSAQRKSQIRTMDRSERIRTYNYPENRIADHRTGYKAYNLDQVMNGDLEPVIQSAIEMDEQARLDAIGE
jgi:peptide chain release factor 1